MELSIVVVSYNAAADLRRCLASIQETPPHASHEIIVADNASTDDSRVVARAAGVRLVELPENRGFAAGNNAGIRVSQGDVLLLLNSDTVVPAGTLDELRRTLLQRDDVGVVGPRLIDAQGRAELSFGSMITPLNEWRQRRVMRALAAGHAATVERIEAMTRVERTPDWVTAACLMVRRADAEAVGLLDERFFMYTEDVDFCAAIRARGKQILFAPHVEIVHLRGRSGAGAPAATRQAYERSHIAFYEKHHPRLAPWVRLWHRLRGWRLEVGSPTSNL